MTFEPPIPVPLNGDEPFEGLDATVIDFWRFAMTDLRTNNIRGYLAEFLVSRAVGATGRRVEWDPWDVTAPDDTRIEVKASGFLQAWAQGRLSRPSFKVSPAYSYDSGSNARSVSQDFNADVYVFCLHTARTHDEYDALSVAQWSFFVAGRSAVAAQAGAAMGLSTLTRVAGPPVTFAELGEAIGRAKASAVGESE